MEQPYDLDGYYCLIIAILLGVNSREAKILYEYGPAHPVFHKISEKRRLHRKQASIKGKERQEVIQQMKKEGYSTEVIADILNCDCSTVNRGLKKLDLGK